MDEGVQIIDIGRDPKRVMRGEAISPFYKMELEEVAKRKYPNRVIARLKSERKCP